MNLKWFRDIKENRLELLIRQGLLKRPDARDILVGFTKTVRQVEAR